ncbi:hypothetical protein [Streptomyces alboniger]|uniref:hypothetical protein n=1 Tax=Streptomyces alboniger TaxID=132473 RepID=UPI0006E1F539|nr:hypothetical protein [Streptomyces alboniger]
MHPGRKEQLFSGAILAADALIVVVALAWLLPAYDRIKHGEVRFFRGLVQFAAQFSMLMVIVSADGFNNSVLERHVAGWATALVYGGAVFMAAIFFVWREPLSPRPRHHPHRYPTELPQLDGPHTGATRSF